MVLVGAYNQVVKPVEVLELKQVEVDKVHFVDGLVVEEVIPLHIGVQLFEIKVDSIMDSGRWLWVGIVCGNLWVW